MRWGGGGLKGYVKSAKSVVYNVVNRKSTFEKLPAPMERSITKDLKKDICPRIIPK